MGLVDKIKNEAKKSGANKGKLFYVRDGQKRRVRFLTDMDDGLEITFHDSFTRGINVPCQEHFGKDCPYCDDDELRTRPQYIWSVWDYDASEVLLLMSPVNNCSPVPALVALYETYGTLLDRDYIIGVSGKQKDKTYSVVPMDKVKFRNEKAKAFSEKKILEILNKAYPTDDEDDFDESPKKNKKRYDEDEEDSFMNEPEDNDSEDYEEMSAKELFKLCKSRGIEAMPKKKEKYYINLLEEYDEAQDDWEDDEDDEWEDD